MGRRRAVAFAVVAVLVAQAAVSARAQTVGDCETLDAGSTAATARGLNPPALCTGSLTQGTDEADWYAIQVRQGQRLVVRVAPVAPLLATGIKILKPTPMLGDPNATTDVTATACDDHSRQPDTCDVREHVAGRWFVGVSRELGSGNYVLTATLSALQNDCGSGVDAPDVYPGVLEVPTAAPDVGLRTLTCTGRFDIDDTADIFGVHVYKSTVLSVRLLPTAFAGGVGTAGVADITDPAGNSRGVRGAAPVNAPGLVSAVTDATGIWRIVIPRGLAHTGDTGDRIDYTLEVTVLQRDCIQDGDTSAATPRGFKDPPPCTGVLDARPGPGETSKFWDLEDTYRITSEAGTPLTALLHTTSGMCAHIAPSWTSRSATVCDGAVAVASGVAPVTGEHTFRITLDIDASHHGGSYEIDLFGAIPLEADCGVTGDAPVYPGSREIELEPESIVSFVRKASCAGDIRTLGDVDDIAFLVAPGEIIDATLGDPAPTNVSLCLLPPSSVPAGGPCQPAKTKVGANQGGKWVARLRGTAIRAQYKFEVFVTRTNDCGTNNDAGDTKGAATPLTLPVVCSFPVAGTVTPDNGGRFSDRALDREDWYRIDVPGPISGLVATLSHQSTNTATPPVYELCVEPPAATGKGARCASTGAAQPTAVIEHSCDVPPSGLPLCRGSNPGTTVGTWYVTVRLISGPPILDPYRLTIAGTP